MQLLLHPGFHKTGTSSLQRSAEISHRRLAKRLQLRTVGELPDCVHAARRYATRPAPEQLERFTETFDAVVAGFDPDPARPPLISCEGLGGRLPGLGGIDSYATMPALCRAMVSVIRARLPQARVTLWLTTRDPQTWLRSAWWQGLRATRLTEDFDTFAARLAAAADFRAIVAQVARAAGFDARVCATTLEACGEMPLGPLGVALRLIGVSDTGLSPARKHNVQPDGAARALLALNRSDLKGDAYKTAKRTFMTDLRSSGSMTLRPDDETQ